MPAPPPPPSRALPLHDFLAGRGAVFGALNGEELVEHFGSPQIEYQALTQSAALLDLSFRGRLCVLGADREKFLHGQVTNDIARLKVGGGCYAALVNAKGKLQSDLFVYKLQEELLLDFEPGLTSSIQERLDKYVIADAVELASVSPYYGLLSVQGPRAREALQASGVAAEQLPPEQPLSWVRVQLEAGDLYVMNQPRFGPCGPGGLDGFDLFVPTGALDTVARALEAGVRTAGGGWAGFQAAETVRIENGIPRFGADMDETHLAPEAGIQERAISYSKGCYIGQEVIARIRTYGQVAKALRLLRVHDELAAPLRRGTTLYKAGAPAGLITSCTHSPKLGSWVALGYVRKEFHQLGTRLETAEPQPAQLEIIGIPGTSPVPGDSA